MDAKVINGLLACYRRKELGIAEVGLLLIQAGCSGAEAALLINREDSTKKQPAQKLTKEQFEIYSNMCVQIKEARPEWRLGQTYFNTLYELYPELADEVRGTEHDPFYNEELIPVFLLYITGGNSDWISYQFIKE